LVIETSLYYDAWPEEHQISKIIVTYIFNNAALFVIQYGNSQNSKSFTMPSDFFPLTLMEGKDTVIAVVMHN
jgi:hypothetical protein